ncbi:DUF2931 family protein [Dyella sp.]|uniref:DUF2931 family protein n=1 Tax=Dyella sp. TaxID=1869338 RepID=UPI002D781CB5|nr:DUF2931 family protein [Dyella sp.]HET7330762.1 DUF2931 family protein [Dyella sp.]
MRYLSYSLVVLAGCALVGATPTRLPYDSWYLGFRAPRYMEVWLETADVEDVRGRVFPGAMSGTVAISYSGEAGGWGQRISMGAGRDVTGAALPKRIYVRWQSLVEPQTYRAVLDIPESTRRLMLSKARSTTVPVVEEYRNILTIALAPGGWVKAWVKSPGSKAVEILCQKAEIEPKGPDQGKYEGRYVTLGPESKEYLRLHPVPYDSWKCPSATASVL